MDRTPLLLAAVVGVLSGLYVFDPILKQEAERQRLLKKHGESPW